MTKDYYKILGVAEFDTADNIKTAYRKLARKWHPDVAGNSADVISRFKEINEAYEILSNQIKKAEYDRARKFYNYAKGINIGQGVNEEEVVNRNEEVNRKSNECNRKETKASSFSFNWEEFLSKKHREAGFKKEEAKAPKRGEDIYSDIEISVFEALSGVSKTINMLQTQICPKCNGRKFINGSTCPHCKGKGETTNYKKFSVKIPAGVKNNSKIRLAGEGSNGINGGVNGDLYITIHILEPKSYKTEGLNILKTIAISPYEAVLGTEVRISTLNGNVNAKIAPNTQNGQKIRLSGCGIVQNNKIGDMILTIEIRIPKNLTVEEINLYKKLQEISSSNIREQQP